MPSRLRSRTALVLLGVAALAGAVVAAPAQAAVVPVAVAPTKTIPSVVWDTCSDAVAAGARCGHIRTPADPLRPELGTQKVGFELYVRSRAGRPSLGTLVAHEGGPGYPTTGTRDYYLELFAPLMDRRDVLLVDERGTGVSGVIRCKPLQHGTIDYEEAVAACGAQLGERNDTYGSAYGADDMALVLDALGIDQIDLYGDSYGTFFSQTFALRHPDRVRTLVLDASYPVSDQDPWYRDTNRAIRDALTRVCERDTTCTDLGGDPVARLRAAAQQAHDHPVSGASHDGEGTPTTATIDGANLALVTANAGYGTWIYRELDAAIRAYDAGDKAPLLRLVAENVSTDPDSGAAADFTLGEYAAVICNDYPQLWDVSLPPGPAREAQYQAAVTSLRHNEPHTFDPFRLDDWISAAWGEPHTCIGWPSPTDPVLPEAPGMTYPDVPTLVLSGDLDSVTSPEGGRIVAQKFPNATFVSVPNVGHVTALGDKQDCAAAIVVRFMRTGGTVGDTSCVETAYAPVRVVPVFARTVSGLGPARQGTAVTSSVADRRVVNASLYTAGDLFSRWYVNYSAAGVGLRGGTFTYTGDDLTKFRLHDLKFVRDVAVDGTVRWNRTNGHVRAVLEVDGPGGRDGTLTVTWNDWTTDAVATVTGELGGRAVHLRTQAP
jgi:pimeloyl-ACP methyl ester carboxylesterase